MILIIGAMQIEIDLLINSMEIKEKKTITSFEYNIGTLFSKPAIVVKCSPGKVNAAVCAQTAIMNFSPTLIINPGVAGGIGKDIKIGSLVVASSCVQHDFDTTPLGEPLGNLTTNKGEIIHLPCDKKYSDIFYNAAKNVYPAETHIGVVATGDTFVADKEKSDFIKEKFSALACEMESGAIAHACYLNDIPFVALRSISDNADDTGKVDYLTFAKSSAHQTEKLVQAVFQNNLNL